MKFLSSSSSSFFMLAKYEIKKKHCLYSVLEYRSNILHLKLDKRKYSYTIIRHVFIGCLSLTLPLLFGTHFFLSSPTIYI